MPGKTSIIVGGRAVEITNPDWLAVLNAPTKSARRAAVKLLAETSLKQIETRAKWEEEMRSLPGVFIPIYLRNPLNRKQHWRPRQVEVKAQRDAAFTACLVAGVARVVPVRVQLTRYGPRRLDPQNVAITVKPIIDGIADHFGPDDGDEWAYTWLEPKQEKSPHGCYGIRIEFEYVRHEGAIQ